MRAMKDMGFKGTILTYAKETVFDHKNQEEFGLGMNITPTNGASSTECPYITSWKQGTLDTVKLLGEEDQLAIFLAYRVTGAGPGVTCALADNSQTPQQFLDAVDKIVRDCKARSAKILIDAESQRFQAGILRIGLDLMRKNNRDGYAVGYNTYQAYLQSTPTSLASHLASALDDNFTLGLKVVRGAYLATDERCLIHDTKEETDDAYDSIAAGALQQQLLGFGGKDGRLFPSVNLLLATHNKYSVEKAQKLHLQRLKQRFSTTGALPMNKMLYKKRVAQGQLRMSPNETQTLCIFGCGNLGRAILTNLVTWNESPFSKIFAVVQTGPSRKKLNEAFGKQLSVLLANEGVAAVQESDVVILGIDPADVAAVLQEPGFRTALDEKLLISIAAGWPSDRIEDILYGSDASGQGQAHVLRALPNIAASVGQSFTALAVSAECSIPEQHIALAQDIFARVGQTARVPPSLMEATTAVAGSTPAMFAVLCDALIDASVAVGMPRQTAEAMVVQSMRGSAELLQSGGMSCATLRDAGTSPEGCTMAAIMVKEERGVRDAVCRALREAVTAARRMESVQHVNDNLPLNSLGYSVECTYRRRA
ncbi:pyrroline-5-carboxylate reductase [Beauveria brongniartii RCEF 3172]|uniref:Pyrroline-5-carboxylate reductase n=1 Tax=Beauveria brongniartii RCEF 3172 TaxID=1081107 RepID=A0A167JUJ6_9HYPO|nr:pyrroline-5-carboxylate reductase [Beauveria brongniartii RCEF 3172]